MRVIITGASAGLGKALAEHYLKQNVKVIGISRNHTINYPDYVAITCDFADPLSLEHLSLNKYLNDEEIMLFNNAGVIGKIQRTMESDFRHFYEVALVNVVALQTISALLLKSTAENQIKTIVNISSGAARRPIASWSAYCASKAAVDLFSLTLQEELNELNLQTKVYSLAPGVIDTQMQTAIRSSDPVQFSSHQNFVDLKSQKALRSPADTAALIVAFLKENSDEVIVRV